MDCSKILLLISSHMDGMLSKEEEDALAKHVAGCVACAGELALQERLSGALRAMGREEIQPPQDIGGLVTSKLRAGQRNTAIRQLPAAWRKAVAAAAAVLLIAGGSAGVTTGLKLAGNGKVVGFESAPYEVSTNEGGGISTSGAPEEGRIVPQDERAQLPGSVNTTDEALIENTQDNENKTLKTTGDDTGLTPGNSGAGDKTAIAAVSPEGETRVFMSSGMTVASTLLKIAVDDLNDARIKAVSLAAGAGAATQTFPEQSGGKKILVLRITVNSDQASGLITALGRLGSVVDRQDESRDIAPLYNETLVQYRDLNSRISMAKDNAELQQLEAQAASYKQQLDAWEAEKGKRVIALWLEER
ncbi:zf-HC2 domain-containing protein [Pelotomaculum sp. PtaB.Bin117]|uniref:anti-sigma factor family protein n=1 Tax=Pelotomaculum sp. PtaB.Bin117 TaxID=1811694 RepID=UPI0009C598DE|nr:zf-HC2 domain-containing protein [Pelotomaculum sp. PtaB.Bin117]OPX91271.1 MAG: hypothetical protein A4E54_00386 [Pelotomaculum sp. PtaB.Bin117]